MMIDSQLVFSDKQAITVDAASTNEIDFGAANLNIGQGSPLMVEVWLDTAFTSTANTLTIKLESSADGVTYAAIDSLTILPATATSSLLAANRGQLVKMSLPENTKRFVRIYYEVSTTLVSGKVNAFITIN